MEWFSKNKSSNLLKQENYIINNVIDLEDTEELIKKHLGNIDENNQIILDKLDKQSNTIKNNKIILENDKHILNSSYKSILNMSSNIGYYLKYLNPFYLFSKEKQLLDNNTALLNNNNNNKLDNTTIQMDEINKYTNNNTTENYKSDIDIMDIIYKIKNDSLKIGYTLDDQVDMIDELNEYVYKNTDLINTNNKIINKLLT